MAWGFRNAKGYTANVWVVRQDPTLVYRALRGFFRALVLRKDTLKTIEITPTLNCNLHCQMCSARKFMKAPGAPLELGDYERIAEQGAKLGALAVTIIGGEPLLAENLVEIISIFRKRKFFVYLVSNSTLATKERLQELHRAGLDNICLSLDSLDEAKNDEVRRKAGHYASVMSAIEAAKEAGLIVTLAPVFFPGQIEKGVEVVKFCQEHGLGASGGQVAPIGAWEGGPTLAPEEHDRLRRLLGEFPRLTFDWALSYFLKIRCPAGREKICITHHGEVIGCSINPISFGNIRDEPLKAILTRMRAFSQVKKDPTVCLVTEDQEYIETYLAPLKEFEHYPVRYREHPAFSPQNEPEIF